ncbi:MAG: ChaN family lipoprotein [Phycisphaerales bacterium]|nr:ChaN family lipoprotein [Phycisphaerales bacterium]
MRAFFTAFGVLLSGLLVAGCAGSGPAVKPAEAEAMKPADARAVPILRGDGAAASWDEVVSAASRAEAVLIGESHGHPVGLPAAAALFEDILARNERAALALEFFERNEQAAVDDYLTGITDAKTFKERTGRTASNYPGGHHAMVELAKAKNRPVIAGNAPRVYVRAARRDGYDRLRGLTPEQARLFRIPDELPTGRYRVDFDAVMDQPGALHGLPEDATPEQKREAKDGMFRSQSVWDWTMAESVARALNAGAAPVVQVVGRFHIEHDGGLVMALEKLRPGTRMVTVAFVDEASAPVTDETSGRADYVVYVGPVHAAASN